MLDRKQLERLVEFESAPFLVTSLYLSFNGGRRGKKACETALKDMVKEKRSEIEGKALTEEQRRSVEGDFRKLFDLIGKEIDLRGKKGLAAFACDGRGLWEFHLLSVEVGNRLVVEPEPYLRPLSRLQSDLKSLCVIVVDRARARLYEIRLGEIEETVEVSDEVTSRIKFGGWKGRLERKLERHAEEEVKRHLKKVVSETIGLYHRRKFEGVLLGGNRELFPELEALLPAHIRERILARFQEEVSSNPGEILKKSLELEREAEGKRKADLVGKLEADRRAKGLAVHGLRDTLAVLRNGQAHLLLIEKGFASPGLLCRQCGFMGVDRVPSCPLCKAKLAEIGDVVGEAVDAALRGGAAVEHVDPGTALGRIGGIGALLRYRS